MTFDEDMAEGLADAAADLGTVSAMIGIRTFTGIFSRLDGEERLEVGGRVAMVAATLLIPKAGAPGKPEAQERCVIAGVAYRVADVDEDEISYTLALARKHGSPA